MRKDLSPLRAILCSISFALNIYLEEELIIGVYFVVVLTKTFVKVAILEFLRTFSFYCSSLIASTSRCFHFCLSSVGLEKLGCVT